MESGMNPLSLEELVFSIFSEYLRSGNIFNINSNYFYKPSGKARKIFFGNHIDLPIGVAAGPHTQLAQNIITSFLTGARVIELKTVQDNDNIQVDKPCISAVDEGYNVEWSTELKIGQALEEYLKAYLLILVLKEILDLKPELYETNNQIDDGFIFISSVGYSYNGIRSDKVNNFLNQLSGKGDLLKELTIRLIELLGKPLSKKFSKSIGKEFPFKILEKIATESKQISNIVTLSTMHGTKPEEIESIIKYLIVEKKLNTILKVNPTLLGYQKVKSILHSHGFGDIKILHDSFDNDLYLEKAFEIVDRSLSKAQERKLNFGIKVSNTLATVNKTKMKGDFAYLSGRALFPISFELAEVFRKRFKNLSISFSAGINQDNVKEVLKSGIYPLTIVTDILKPGGYYRLYTTAMASDFHFQLKYKKINASEISTGEMYQKIIENPFFPLGQKVVSSKLPLFDCFIAPCTYSCPINQDVPAYLRFIENKDYNSAIRVIFSKNPLPFITSTICVHYCTFNCTRRYYDKSIKIREQKLFASKKGFNYLKDYIISEKKNIVKNNIKVAVVGAGPAGISAANFLARAGFDVTIFEKEELPGGIVATTIPNFRIKKQRIKNDIELLKLLDVKIENKKIEKISELKNEGYKHIIVAIGSDMPKQLKLEYADGNILDSIGFLRKYNKREKINPGKNVVIVGGGNSAIDAARAAVRIPGVKRVTIVYRRTENELPADREEYENACFDGISFRMLRQPVSYKNKTLTCEIMQLSDKDRDKDGRKISEPTGKYEILKADSLIVAIGEDIDRDWFIKNDLLSTDSKNFNKDDEIYFVGDCLNGPSSVVEAIASAQKVVNQIFEKNNIKEDIFSQSIPRDSLKSIDEKSLYNRGKTQKEIKEDFKRCLNCDLYCSRCVDVCPNRANRVIPYSSESFSNYFQIIHLDYLCNECGNCETFCPYEGSPYKDKFTIFDSSEKFEKSKNPGIFISSFKKNNKSNKISFSLRTENREILNIKAEKIEGKYISKDKSKEINFGLYLINNYPEIFKDNFNFDD